MLSTLDKGMPGLTSERTATPVQLSYDYPVLRGGKIIGAASRDPRNTPTTELRAGMLLGYSAGNVGLVPTILGPITALLEGDDTTIAISAATSAEIVRRIGATGTIEVIGPPQGPAGVCRAMSFSFSGATTTGTTLTISATGVAEVQTLTLQAGTDGGTFCIKYKDALSAAQAYDVSNANLQTALRALHTDLAAVTVSGTPGSAYTVTWPQKGSSGVEYVVPDLLTVVNDSTTDYNVYEGGVVVARTAAGVNADFISGSILSIPADGTDTPQAIFLGSDGYPVKVIDQDGVSRDLSVSVLVGAQNFDDSLIVDWPSDSRIKTYLKDCLKASGCWSFLSDLSW